MKSRTKAPVTGGVRRKRTKAPSMSRSGDSTIIKYQTLGTTLATPSAVGGTGEVRFFIPGCPSSLANTIGTGVVSAYSEGKYLPNCRIRWEPSVAFTTSGRVLVGFTDNPEVIVQMNTALVDFLTTPSSGTLATYASLVRGLGTMISFPVWQETDVQFPTRTRRKMFDVNKTLTGFDTNLVDRCCQTAMFYVVDGAPTSTTLGSFHYSDCVSVEGIQGVST